jgi:uncharacterized FAD-dependent dehydrogenase
MAGLGRVPALRGHYDVAIVGGGVSGLLAAHRLCGADARLSVCVLEKGAPYGERACAVLPGASSQCAACASCAIMSGLGGAGLFRGTKFLIATDHGSWLPDILPAATVLRYIDEVDAALMAFGGPARRYLPNRDLIRECLGHSLHMGAGIVKHFATDTNASVAARLIAAVAARADVHTRAKVAEVDPAGHRIALTDGRALTADRIVLAVGRAGSRFFDQWCKRHGVRLRPNQVDIGVRVELDATIWDRFARSVYEPKISYVSKQYGDVTRLFSFNHRGSVIPVKTGGVVTVNGHSFRERGRRTRQSNFALLTTINFTQPFQEPVTYARHCAQLANLISGGTVLLQRLGDLRAGRRSSQRRLWEGTVKPTLAAVAGDLSLCFPKRQLDDIIETLGALDNVAPGTANDDTLLYGVEVKYYSARPEVSSNFEIQGCKGIYGVGDGAGFTRSLSHAGANALYVADVILGKNPS